eukprot:gene5162-7186_t
MNYGTSANKTNLVKLGGSNLMVSPICLGTMTWGQQNTEIEGMEQLDYAIKECGINFIDTAEMYLVPTKAETQGMTDKIIGKWLKSYDRSKIILATKVAGYSDRLLYLPGRNGKGSRVSKEQILVSVEESLKRLQTDYIDLLQIHWPDRYVPLFGDDSYSYNNEREFVSFQEQLETLHDLVKCGKVRAIGVSNETPYGVMKFSELSNRLNLSKMISIQNSYSLLNRNDFERKYAQPDCPSTARLNLFPGYMARYKQSLAQEAVKEYSLLANKYSLTPSELSLAWCYSRKHVASTIIGATSMTQLKENIQAFNKKDSITTEVEDAIKIIYKRFKDPSKL